MSKIFFLYSRRADGFIASPDLTSYGYGEAAWSNDLAMARAVCLFLGQQGGDFMLFSDYGLSVEWPGFGEGRMLDSSDLSQMHMKHFGASIHGGQVPHQEGALLVRRLVPHDGSRILVIGQSVRGLVNDPGALSRLMQFLLVHEGVPFTVETALPQRERME